MTIIIIRKWLDSNKSIIFNQSSVNGHAELAWILNCVTRLGWLNRMTQFKDKAGSDKEKASVGLYIYPVLMAADILLYDATHVPVGEDQKQHLELSRDIAQKFNLDFNAPNFLRAPEPLIQKNFSRIMSLKDGTKKMSKSDISNLSRINLTDQKDDIVKKIQKAKTDAFPIPEKETDLNGRFEAQNLINIYAGLIDKTPQEILNEYAGKGFAEFKNNLIELLIEKIAPVSTNMSKLLKDKQEIKNLLLEGSIKARAISENVLNDVKKIIGFV